VHGAPRVPAKELQRQLSVNYKTEFPDYPIEPGCQKSTLYLPACIKTGNDAKFVAKALWDDVSEEARSQCFAHVWKPNYIYAYVQYQKLEGCLEAQLEREELQLPPHVFEKN
jgi:hypothetical protein